MPILVSVRCKPDGVTMVLPMTLAVAVLASTDPSSTANEAKRQWRVGPSVGSRPRPPLRSWAKEHPLARELDPSTLRARGPPDHQNVGLYTPASFNCACTLITLPSLRHGSALGGSSVWTSDNNWEHTMKARPLIDDASFGPQSLKVIAQAFDDAWRDIAGNFGSEPVIHAARLQLAAAVLSVSSDESRDAAVIKHAALQAMARRYKIPRPVRSSRSMAQVVN